MSHARTTVPLPDDVAAELVRHVRQKTTDQAESQLEVPIEHFVSQSRAVEEIALMKRLPLNVAHVSEIPAPGDFITRTILGAPLLIVRQKNNAVAIFRNMCRHRGGIVEQALSGNKSSFMCQYHGWTYDGETGALNPVFYEESFGPIKYDCSGLHRVKTEVRHGLIFATLNPGPKSEPIADYLGPEVEALMAPWELDTAKLFLDKSFERTMNWKLVVDGAIDPLHPMFLHNKPGGVGERTLPNTAVFRAFGRHGKMYGARDKLKKFVDDGANGAVTTRHVGSVMVLYPNSILVEAPDHVEFWNVWPNLKNPGECTVNIRFFVRPGILTPEMEARINKSWDILSLAALEEDFPMEQAIQANAEARPEGAFVYGRNEKAAQHLHRQLALDLSGQH